MTASKPYTANTLPEADRSEEPCVDLQFVVSESTGELQAQVSAAESPLKINLKSLRARLVDEGFGGLEIDDPTLVELLRGIRRGEIGATSLAKLDGGVALALDYEDASRNLYATLSPSDGASPLTLEAVKRLVDDAGFGQFEITQHNIADIAVKAQQKKLGRYLLGKKPEYTRVDFDFDEATQNLYADLSICEEESVTSGVAIMDELRRLGFDGFQLEANAIDKLYTQISKNVRGRFVIGQRRDAQVDIEFDEDLMTAYMTISPPQGGRDLDEHLLDIALANAGIYRGCCDETVLEKIIAEKSATKIQFAQGSEPVDGIDAEFEALVQEVEYSAPRENKSGKVDLREIVSFTIVEPSTPLMRRTPGKPGSNGRNVKGQVITAIESDDAPFDDNLPGAEICPHDPNLLLSSCRGHPVILPHGVRVDNTIVVNNVDMSTGNISYDGSILIKGEVKSGMKVKVTGDIIVKGVVTKAHLLAKNSITVECGIIGSDPAKEGEDSPPAVLKAGGDVNAQYMNLVEVSAGRDVVVREYISHCNVDAKHKVLAGKGGGKGRIFGGTCYGKAGVFARSIGASGGVKTVVCAGTLPDQQKQYDQLITSHENRIEQAKQVAEIMKRYDTALKSNPEDGEKVQKAAAVKKVLDDIRSEIDRMAQTIAKIDKHFKECKKSEVSASKSTFPNVAITINGAEFLIRQESKGGIFVKRGDDIRWLNYRVQ